ncbi:MAG: acyl-CoA dehydrogenase family protein [Alphaproteobacteria bacterium]|nr:acyl-CoA dehydrogenase family protein [Alphaproteobacteria bacterium]MDE2266539.1 acyl-CoA dehydrogenase family protein [Alphaproteobacteria bacterium]MDE2499518.1 acyl-CoA dehydrogenase family protein [Alphaproteobacteria bacterium]
MRTMLAPHLLARCDEAVLSCEGLLAAAKDRIGKRLKPDGVLVRDMLDREQRAAHALAWLATYVEALRQMARWARRLKDENRLGDVERLILQIAFGEYLAQIVGGIPMSQSEIARLSDLDLDDEDRRGFRSEVVGELIALGTHAAVRAELAAHLSAHSGAMTAGDPGLDDTMNLVRGQFFRFAQEKIAPQAQGWHLKDELIPLDIVAQMSALGVFGLTIPQAYGGAGLSKTAMCVVSEELSRAYLGVGSLATRSEIAAELILSGGTKAQRERLLPRIADGAMLPAAVFTEPDAGSDLGSLRTRAVRQGDVYRITGGKTWITHAARADVMALLVRTDPATGDYRGLSMFIAEKPRGTDNDPFPVSGMTGGEIAVLGYRGMKEYEIAFDGFEVPAENLLGGVEGQGFKQLMSTFETARIQTAARAIGVAASALDSGLRYALERRQSGKMIFEFPRVADKLVMTAVEIAVARQLAYFAAREKDEGRRCDLEAGMAKLLAARIAWAAADGAVQIHGGNGFALDYPVSRILCDARILNIFEGAAEIQAQVIARRLLDERGN